MDSTHARRTPVAQESALFLADRHDLLPARNTRSGGDLHDVYYRLRQGILSGAIAPGEIINQVHIAKLYGVSRTPVREALRMLQAENLVEAQFQHRMRVTAVTPQEVDAVYATWILVQCLGAAMTVPRINADELAEIRQALHDMHCADPLRTGSSEKWQDKHFVFHRKLVMHAGPVIIESIENCWSRSERARRAYTRTAPESWHDSEDEHNALVEAYAAGDIAHAVYISGRQLVRIARIVIGHIDPGYEPQAIRQAMNLASGASWSAEPIQTKPAARGRNRKAAD